MVLRERFELSKLRFLAAYVCQFHHHSIFWWHLRDLNSALPDWKSGVLTIRLRCRIGDSCENWTRVSRLRIRRRNHLTKEPYGGTGGTWTHTSKTDYSRISNPLSYQLGLPLRIWRLGRDSNPQPPDRQSGAPLCWATEPYLVVPIGIEPMTLGLWNQRSDLLSYGTIWWEVQDSNLSR